MAIHRHFTAVIFITVLAAGAKEQISIVVSMVEPQFQFFSDSVVAPFAAANSIEVAIVNSPDIDGIGELAMKTRGAGLFMVPFGKAWAMADTDKIWPLTSFLSKHDMQDFNGEYILTWLGRRDDEQYFMPAKYETRIMAYRKSKVAAAVERWENGGTALRDSIAGLLRSVNGRGLPAGYSLEGDPGSWDFFDVFVAGAVWASMPGNRGVGRIGHRGKRYSGTALRVIDRVIQCGGDSSTMLSMKGNPVTDAFTWEAVYAAFGICNSGMFSRQWSGRDLWDAFAKETIYLSFMTQIDCFFIHGGDRKFSEHLADTADLGLTVMPSGCSIELDSENRVKRTGTRAVTSGGWWWAIPAAWSDPELAYRLFRHITSPENQFRECRAFGTIPVRNDVLKDDRLLSDSNRYADIFRVSYAQMRINNDVVVPASSAFDRISGLYLDAWFKIVAGKNWADRRGAIPDRNAIGRFLDNGYAPQAREIVRQAVNR